MDSGGGGVDGPSVAWVTCKEYAALIDELNLNDDQLPGIMAELERTTQTRKGDTENSSISRELAPDPE